MTTGTLKHSVERRSHPRYQVPLHLTVCLKFPSGSVIGRVLDISDRGFGILARCPKLPPLVVGESQAILIHYGDKVFEEQLKVKSVDSGREGFRLGLAVPDISSFREVLANLLRYVRKHEEFVRTHQHL